MASVKSAIASMVRNIEEKTGKSLAAWIKIARSGGLKKHSEIVAFLKSDFELSHGYANFVAKEALKDSPTAGEPTNLLAAQYAGNKSNLRPLYDKLIAVVTSFGEDVEIAPKKANVSVRRNKQFALIQPTTQTRIDVGLILKDVKPSGRLEASGSFNAMFTHRVRVGALEDIDTELRRWLKQAYNEA
jgi:hypothetical protein